VAPTFLAIAFFVIADRRVSETARPEYWLFAAWIVGEMMIASSAALTGGAVSPVLAGLAIPIVTLSARFPLRGVIAGVLVAVSLVIIVSFGFSAAVVIASPPELLVPIAIILSIAVLSTALMRSDLQHRTDAVIDQLTGMLNRKALATRSAELTQQSAVSGEPVGIIVGDIDRFKSFNDSFGHATGDAVLKDVSYLIRKELRAFDLAYRLGGEEFLVLVPGSTTAEAVFLAEKLRLAIEEEPLGGGHPVTMSFGVASSSRGSEFDYESIFELADAALYFSKNNGRNIVSESDSASVPAALC
jgi:diguanylate cyclase (GGDEF)-like protein